MTNFCFDRGKTSMKWIYTRNVSTSRENTRKWQLTRHFRAKRYLVNIGTLKNSPINQDKPPNTGPVSPTEATAFSVCLVNPTDYQTDTTMVCTP